MPDESHPSQAVQALVQNIWLYERVCVRTRVRIVAVAGMATATGPAAGLIPAPRMAAIRHPAAPRHPRLEFAGRIGALTKPAPDSGRPRNLRRHPTRHPAARHNGRRHGHPTLPPAAIRRHHGTPDTAPAIRARYVTGTARHPATAGGTLVPSSRARALDMARHPIGLIPYRVPAVMVPGDQYRHPLVPAAIAESHCASALPRRMARVVARSMARRVVRWWLGERSDIRFPASYCRLGVIA